MSELTLKLALEGIILLIAVIGWRLENKWHDSRTPMLHLVARRVLILLLAVAAITSGALTYIAHGEEQEEQMRIASIDQNVVELVRLARERDPALSEEEALEEISVEVRTLRARTSELEREIDGVKRYGDVAKLNAFGLSGKIGPGSGLKETTAISQALEAAYIRKETKGRVRYFPRCDSTGIASFERATEIDADFPFSYWALAICAAAARDEGWRTFAETGISMLEHTTQISGHHAHHDAALEELRSMLGQQ